MSDTSTHTSGSSGPEKKPGKSKDKRGLFARISLFIREVIAELRKVIWPTRKELITYTWVVIVFVTVFTLIVAVYDLVFTRLVLQLFG